MAGLIVFFMCVKFHASASFLLFLGIWPLLLSLPIQQASTLFFVSGSDDNVGIGKHTAVVISPPAGQEQTNLQMGCC